MKTNSNKRFSRKHDRKVWVAEESTKSWADSDSDASSSSSSSSESEQEEVHCFMADQTDEDESSSAESSSDEQDDADILKTELSKLQAENELLRNEISELKAEVAKSTVELSSWNKANITLQKICENQKQASDKTGIGFSDSEFYEGESSTQSRPSYDKKHVKRVALWMMPRPIRFNEFRKNVLAQNASIFVGLADVRKEVQDVNAKVDIMAKRLNDIQKDDEASKEALSHQLLEFQSSAQENHNVIHAQLSEIVAYIHRGSADKKGESGSRGLQKPSSIQKEGSAVTPSFEQRVQMAQRRIVQTVLDFRGAVLTKRGKVAAEDFKSLRVFKKKVVQ
ncbi:hypothetical protein F511_29340 [Dorcoceras hygrometricum]|uniref:Uncharacterized protein n=1 Tax=Dorcoceras hygrometricum TaxID=472368 RepID=A0A2Z7AYF6_9LAMI|nr:hypothetical protein F511_29340 [Dorcoceras hygrometricum]